MATGGFINIDDIVKELNDALSKIKGKTLKGLIRSVIAIREHVDKSPPLIPLDTGNLRSSFFTVTSENTVEHGMNPVFTGKYKAKLQADHNSTIDIVKGEMKTDKEPAVVFGFSANYASKVHEDRETKFKRPGSGPGFLSSALHQNKKKILKIIADEVKL